MVLRSFHNILTTDLPRARDFYLSLFDYDVAFDSDWFVHLQATGNAALELGIIAAGHEITTAGMGEHAVGGLLTIVVDDVDEFHERAVSLAVNVVETPRDLFYGQRRMVITDPDGQFIDVSSECDPDPDWLATLSQ